MLDMHVLREAENLYDVKVAYKHDAPWKYRCWDRSGTGARAISYTPAKYKPHDQDKKQWRDHTKKVNWGTNKLQGGNG